ncbi:MAG: tetratricopeptide repeat protein [Candidatus Aminicenantales bacterium]
MTKILFLGAFCLVLVFCATTESQKAKENENDPQYQYQKAVVALKYGFEDEAIKYLDQAISLDPQHFQSYKLLGLLYFQKKNFEQAAAAYQKCLEIKPDLAEVHNQLGRVYWEMGQAGKAEEEFKKSFFLDGNAGASYNLAEIYFKQEKLQLALDYIQKCLLKKEGWAKAYNLQGVILNKMGQFSEAIQSFKKAMKISANEADKTVYGLNLSVAYINNKEYNKARSLLENLLLQVKDEHLRIKINEYLKMIGNKEPD